MSHSLHGCAGMARFAALSAPAYGMSFRAVSQEHTAAIVAYARAEPIPDWPVALRLRTGHAHPGDAVWPDIGAFVASPRLLDLLAEFSGWRPYPVELRSKAGHLLPGYAGVAITGRCGPLCFDTSRVEGEGSRAEYVGMWFDSATWDGSDLFRPPNVLYQLAVERVVRAIKGARIKHIDVEPLPDMRYSKADWDRDPNRWCLPGALADAPAGSARET